MWVEVISCNISVVFSRHSVYHTMYINSLVWHALRVSAMTQEKESWEFYTVAIRPCYMQDTLVNCLDEGQNCHQQCV